MNTYVRKLTLSEDRIDFASNDYLGLAQSEEFHAELQGLALPPGSHGATGSRLLTGNHRISEEVEAFLSDRWGVESCLIFPSGYMANLGLLSALGDRHTTIIYDQYAHACIKDGARLSQARRLSFRHNDLEHLQHRLAEVSGKVYVVVESLYSMDGDTAPLEDLCDLCEKYNVQLIVDEAHATGVLGKSGGGLSEELGLSHRVFATVNTFGKGIGLHGASVSGPAWLKELLINQSRPFIYTTAPPPALFYQLRAAFLYVDKHPELRVALDESISKFKQAWESAKLPFELKQANHGIQAVMIPDATQVRNVASNLRSAGFDVRPILPPTIPEGTERIRICLHAHNSNAQINALVHAFSEI